MKKITGKRLPKILVVCGPTAVGKSDLAVDLALKFNGEVISADSRQVYTGLDIGSGKITIAEMKGVPHYLLNIADPKKARYTVDDFKRDGETAIADIISRGKLPIICGGTGFYIDALVKGEIFPNVPPNQALRKKLATKTAEALMKEITKLDPRRAKALDPYNKVRIIRAIEIARALGSVPKIKTKKKYDVVSIGLTLDRPKIHSRIHTRLLKRMDTGMVQEIAKLHKKGVPWKRLEAFGLEYRYLALYLQKKLSKEEMLAKLESEIVAYSKRQMQWFKMNKEIQWFKPGENSRVVKVIKRCGIV